MYTNNYLSREILCQESKIAPLVNRRLTKKTVNTRLQNGPVNQTMKKQRPVSYIVVQLNGIFRSYQKDKLSRYYIND